MTKKQKLELTWVGKDQRPRLEPRVLVEDLGLSYHAGARRPAGDHFDNLLIHGDNLLALKALEAEYSGKVKCVFIDPPYNTGSAFTHYDDGLEHSIWLGLMRDRLEIIRRLLSDDGSLWITIDDNEAHYLKVMCDEIFGRANFVANVVWKKKYTVSNDAKWFSDNHDHILIIAGNKDVWRPNKLPRSEEMNSRYANPDNHPKGPWKATPLHAKSGSEKGQKFTFKFKNGYVWSAPAGTFPRFSEDSLRRYDEGNEIWFGRDGTAQPSRKTFLSELTNDGTPPLTVWLNDEVGHNHEAKTEAKEFNSTDVFATPKPERLLNRILHIATNPGDLVLDSFAGSGTTGAVAHKMGRKWIMVELGEHCHTHIVPRLQKVIDGTDQGGISKAVDWHGGGGFRYYNLAPSLMEKDRWGREVISKDYNAAMLAEALCKLEGFTFQPSPDVWWQQGQSTENDFLYVTTQTLGPQELAALSDEVGDDRSLLVLCSAWVGGTGEAFPNLTLRKIPNHIRNKCEWGKDDYSLNVANLPMAAPMVRAPENKPTRTPLPNPDQGTLFDGGDDQ
jgi:adenine-specific DNA-methyltransferase